MPERDKCGGGGEGDREKKILRMSYAWPVLHAYGQIALNGDTGSHCPHGC